MSTAVSLAGTGIDDASAERFFHRVRELEGLLSRFRPDSQISRIARQELSPDDADPAVQDVLLRCEILRLRTDGDFDHQPRTRSGDPTDPALDVNAVAKGYIIDDAAAALRDAGGELIVNAGGDVLATPRADGRPWRIAIQHPHVPDAVFGTIEIPSGAVATSGAYARGDHLRTAGPAADSVTVTGPDLATADGLSTAAYAAGGLAPSWWPDVPPQYGLLILARGRWHWQPPTAGSPPLWQPAVRPVRRAVST